MAKGNMLLGYARGSVGDVTFARVKGQQTAHARNRNPSNPKTPAQMWQRARLATAVNFFKTTRASTFKFAFEDRMPNESDYNAFMRHNIKRFVVNPKEYNNLGYFPYGEPYITNGSLPTIDYAFDDGEGVVDWGIEKPTGTPTGPTTVKQLYETLKNAYSWIQEGDIITAVVWYAKDSAAIYSSMPFLRSTEDASYEIMYSQETLSSADTDQVDDIFNFQSIAAGSNISTSIPEKMGYEPKGFAMIISRNTAEGLKVSTQKLDISSAHTLLDCCSEGGIDYETWRDYICQTWDASEEAILQGALS